MAADFNVPQEVVDALAALDAAAGQIDEYAVQGLLAAIGTSLGKLPDAVRRGLAAEALAFNFVGQNGQTSMWGTHFGPMMTGEDNTGNFVCIPDVRQVDPIVIHYWAQRAATVAHPVFKARYADLVWDLARAVGEKPDVEMARRAIDAYLAATTPQYRDGLHARLTAAIRGFDLSMQIKDVARMATARTNILDLHAEAIANNAQVWWLAPNRLLRDNRTGMSAAESAVLIKTLEDLVLVFGDINIPARFDPNALEQAAGLLQKHYRRQGTAADIKRLYEAVAHGYEAAAGIADPMVASSFLQSAVNAYSAAGMKDEVAQVRILMQSAIQNSNKAMKSIGTEIEVKKDDVDAFVAAIVDDDPGMTFARIANEFLSSKTGLETQMQEAAKAAPLQAMIPLQIMQDDHVAATIGSIKDDPVGRLVHQADMHFSFSALWLMKALDGAIEKHDLIPDNFAGWSNRLGLFEDTTFLKEGFAAWLEGDYVKALHVLVPQAEHGLRAIAASVGVPVTKPHPATQDASVSIGMGDILANDKVLAVIGEDIALHFRALYSDPRGMNLRNRVAHGLYSSQSLNPHIVRLVVHSLLVFGIWQDLVKLKARAVVKDKP